MVLTSNEVVGVLEEDVLAVVPESLDTEEAGVVVGEAVVSREAVGSSDRGAALDDGTVLVVGQSTETKETLTVDTVCVSVTVSV